MQQNEINSDLLNKNKNKIISQPTANMSQFLNYSDLHLTNDRTVSGMLSSSPAALETLGHPVQAMMGAHPVVTWSTLVHPVHHHVTSSYPLVGAVGPGSSVDYMTPSLSTNPFVDVGYCLGLPPPPTGTPVPDVTRMTPSLSTFNPGLSSVLLDFRLRRWRIRLLDYLLLRHTRLRYRRL